MSNIPVMEVPVPTVDEVGLDQCIISGRTAKELISRRQYLKTTVDHYEQEVKDIDIILGTALDLRHIKNVISEDWLVIRRAGSRPRALLDRVLLMEAGVTPQQLEAGTKLSEPGEPGITVKNLNK